MIKFTAYFAAAAATATTKYETFILLNMLIDFFPLSTFCFSQFFN